MSAVDRSYLVELWRNIHDANAQALEDQREHLRYSGVSAETAVARLKETALTGWNPIETAPKDGTMVLLYCGEGCGTMLARWIAPCNFLNESEYRGDLGDWEDEDWFFADFVEGGRVSNDGVPTHWMPLPKKPRTETAQQRPTSTETDVNEQGTEGDSGTNKTG